LRIGKGLSRLYMAVITLAVMGSVITTFLLADSVRQEIDRLAAPNSDTMQWSLAQTEVDPLA
jgi:hypothetical protein